MRGEFQREERIDPDIKKILIEIQKLAKFKDLETKNFSNEQGYADILAGKLRGRMKTAQLRRFFSEIKVIDKRLAGGASWKEVEAEFYLLKPRLAYAKGRKLIPNEFYDVVRTALNKVDIGTDNEKKENFETLVRFLEAVVAYHKFYGGD